MKMTKISKPLPWTRVTEGVFSARVRIIDDYGGYGFYETRVYRVENPENLPHFLRKCEEWQQQGLSLDLGVVMETPEYLALGKCTRVGRSEINY